MNPPSTYFLSRVFLILLINICAVSASAQTRFGISYPSELSDNDILDSVNEIMDLGISIIELRDPVSDDLLTALSNYQVQILVRSSHQFITLSEINNSEPLKGDLTQFVLKYANNPGVSGLGLTSFSEDLSTELLQDLLKQIPDSSQLNFYQVGTSLSSNLTTIIQTNSFRNVEVASNYLFEAPFKHSDIYALKKYLDVSPDLIFMDWAWFNEASADLSFFRDAISIASESSENLLPTNEGQKERSYSQWPVIILVLLWLSMGIHLKSNPTYRPLIFRYFTFHRFFVDDIMRYRERSAAQGVTLFIQHAYFTGLVAYILSDRFISDKGLEALYHHLPVLAVFGKNYFTLFGLTVICALIISFFGLIWVYLPNKSMKHFSQVVNLYSWIFHLDFIIVSIMLILLITQGSSVILLFLAGSHLLCWVFAFILSTYDSSKYLMTGKVRYFIKTVGIFIPVLIGIIILFFYSGYPYEVLRLVINL